MLELKVKGYAPVSAEVKGKGLTDEVMTIP
jgi:hypothetical protein